jgi:hypothetical protein
MSNRTTSAANSAHVRPARALAAHGNVVSSTWHRRRRRWPRLLGPSTAHAALAPALSQPPAPTLAPHAPQQLLPCRWGGPTVTATWSQHAATAPSLRASSRRQLPRDSRPPLLIARGAGSGGGDALRGRRGGLLPGDSAFS